MTSKKGSASPLLIIISFATVYIVWGSTYFFIAKALEGFPPFTMGALRFIIAGIMVLVWCLLKGEKIFVLPDIKQAAITGFLLLSVGTGVVIWVEQYLASAFVAIMVSAAPIWFVLFDKRKWKENFTSLSAVAGLVIGFAGVIVLFGEKMNAGFFASGNKAQLLSMFLLLVGMISWTSGSLYSKYKTITVSTFVSVGWQMFAAGIPFIPLSFLFGEVQSLEWQAISLNAWLSLIYLILFGSIAAYSAYVWLLKVCPATQVSTYAYVNPVVAVLLGVYFGNEDISFLQIFGLVIILASVLLINLAKYRAEKKVKVPV